ncbi:hypothetical protein LCGC14_3137020, partial [marine sediment metagenome]
MTGKNYYLLSFLPSLVTLGDQPPLSCADFLDRLSSLDSPRPGQLGEAVFLSDDLLQREAFLVGELENPAPTRNASRCNRSSLRKTASPS